MDSLLMEEAVSEKLQVSLACLKRWRLQGEGPKYVKMGPTVRYRPQDIEDWLGTLPTGGKRALNSCLISRTLFGCD
jgi:predicted DNA-binding transcriptional regulator AlpA